MRSKASALWTSVAIIVATLIAVEWLVTDERREISDYCHNAITAYGPVATSQVDCP